MCRPLHGGWHVLSALFTLPVVQHPSSLYIRILTTSGRTRGLRLTLPILVDAERFAYLTHGVPLASALEWPVPAQQDARSINLHAVVPFPIRRVAELVHAGLTLELKRRDAKHVLVFDSDFRVRVKS